MKRLTRQQRKELNVLSFLGVYRWYRRGVWLGGAKVTRMEALKRAWRMGYRTRVTKIPLAGVGTTSWTPNG